MDDSNSKRERLKAVVLLLIGFIIGFAAHAFTTTGDVEAPAGDDVVVEDVATTTTGTDSTSSEDTVANNDAFIEPVDANANNASGSGYSVSVNDQSAGSIVHVSQVVLEKDSWVAVREDLQGGLGNILGAAWYPAGTHTASVELLRDTQPDSFYYAVIYADNGDKTFDFNEDMLVNGDDNKVLVAKFRAY
jgi:hypothetical protein